MTKEEKLIVSAYTGVLLCDYADFHAFAEGVLERAIDRAEFSSQEIWDDLKMKTSSMLSDLGKEEEAKPIIEVNAMYLYDQEEIYHNCAVQVLTNTATGEQSWGWWPENDPPTFIRH